MTTLSHAQTGLCPTSPANLLGLDYRAQANVFEDLGPIIDLHTHVTSPQAAEVYLQAAGDYGITRTFTMTGIDDAVQLRQNAFDSIDFICVPDYRRYMQTDDPTIFVSAWMDDIRRFRSEVDCRIIKLWAAPRGRDFLDRAPDAQKLAALPEIGNPMLLDSPIRQRGVELALELGYKAIMVHVADPDTWFATKYADAERYGTKAQQYDPLRRLLERYPDVPVIGAHMGGYPENLDFIQDLLDQYPNYRVDTSATKWQVRELSKHPARLAAFCNANPGRVLFGSDIVANAENVVPTEIDPSLPEDTPGVGQGFGYDLYASRYWALRTLLETDYDGPSPIVDPDLHLVDPHVPENAAPPLVGANLPRPRLIDIYREASTALLRDIDAY